MTTLDKYIEAHKLSCHSRRTAGDPCTCGRDESIKELQALRTQAESRIFLQFGDGLIGVSRTAEQGEEFDSGLAFMHLDRMVGIGQVAQPGIIGLTTDQAGAFLRFHFTNADSVQVLIDDLEKICDDIKNQDDIKWNQGEHKKHFLVFDRPHLYACTCGYEVAIFPSDEMIEGKVFKKPSKEIEYMNCGHAVCARRDREGEPYCIICTNSG